MLTPYKEDDSVPKKDLHIDIKNLSSDASCYILHIINKALIDCGIENCEMSYTYGDSEKEEEPEVPVEESTTFSRYMRSTTSEGRSN